MRQAIIQKQDEMYKLIMDTIALCEKSSDMSYIQNAIIRKHGHSESCMARQNIGFLLAAFIIYGEDFKRGVEEAFGGREGARFVFEQTSDGGVDGRVEVVGGNERLNEPDVGGARSVEGRGG